MNNPSENSAPSSSETDRPQASQSIPHPGAHPGDRGEDQWPEWMSRRLQFAIPAWAMVAGVVVLLLIALD